MIWKNIKKLVRAWLQGGSYGDEDEEPNERGQMLISKTEAGKLFITIAKGICPDCGTARKFYEGPSGGMSTNIQCEAGHWFNVTPVIGIAERIKR